MADILKKGFITVDDDIRFKYHTEVLRLFGKELKAHMKATYKFDDKWMVWFPKIYKNRDFINEMLNDGKTITMRQLPTSLLESDKTFPEELGECIVFAHFIDPSTSKKYYRFVGVFTRLVGNMKYASCQRTSSVLYFDGKGRFSSKP